MKILVAGVVGRHHYGGVAWCSLMYLLGLERLGHEVWYFEDTGEWYFDPATGAFTGAPEPAMATIRRAMEPYGFGPRWCYVEGNGRRYGPAAERWPRHCAEADLLINLSGGCWFWRDEYARVPRKVFIDSDPVFTQTHVVRNVGLQEFMAEYDALFTFGHNVGRADCGAPDTGFDWKHTWQPVVMDEWKPWPATPHRYFTTVMSWQFHSFKDVGGNKDVEFRKVQELPALTDVPLEVAVSGPLDTEDQLAAQLTALGWRVRSGLEVSRDMDSYRTYLRGALGEFSVAKHTYVVANSGWFSDRTGCFLAAARPAIVQDTGVAAHVPTGHGLLVFASLEQAADALEQVMSRYEHHRQAAHEFAQAYLSSDVVLRRLLEEAR